MGNSYYNVSLNKQSLVVEIQKKSLHEIIEIVSNYISETSDYMYDEMHITLKGDLIFQKQLKEQLLKFDLFKIDKSFTDRDIKNACLLASFLSYLKRLVPESVYELTIGQTIFDHFIFSKNQIKKFEKSIVDLKQQEFAKLNIDIFGAVYNTLFSNPEQSEKAQHFTDIDEIDIINAFCINKNTNQIIDTACGAGAFLIRAYEMLKHYHPESESINVLEKIYGVELAPFPLLITKINLLSSNTIDNPYIIQKDFSDINKTDLPEFDACIGNPPYIRQELIENKQKWIDQVKQDFKIKNLNKQSDLYVYYLMHTASLLKEGGRLGYVIASSWLDVSFGKDLQNFLLNHFKIIAIIDQQDTRSFKTASVNTIILILEKCSNQQEREDNQIKFVKIKNNYSDIVGQIHDSERFKNIFKFTELIENSVDAISEDCSIHSVNQKELEKQSIRDGKYHNGHWGAKYLRSPEIFNQIISGAKNNLVPLRDICNIKYGIKTGANNFFYLVDETQKAVELKKKNKEFWNKHGWYYSKLDGKHYMIDRKHIKPLLKTQREVQNLAVNTNTLGFSVLDIKNVNVLNIKDDLYKYIKLAESSKYKINKRPTCSGRKSTNGNSDWFNLGKDISIGDFIFPSKIGEKFRLIDNRKAKVYCDKVNYNVCIKPEFSDYSNILFAILNSTFFRFFIDLFARQLTGSQTLSDVDVNVLEDTSVPHPKLFVNYEKELVSIMKSMNNRKQESIFKEMEYEDRKQLDSIIMKALGFGKKESEMIRKEAVKYVQLRKNKSESLKTLKKPIKK